MTLDEFEAVCDRFTNKRLFVTRPPRRAGPRPRTATSRRSTTTTSSRHCVNRVAIVDYGLCNLDSVRAGARGVRRAAPRRRPTTPRARRRRPDRPARRRRVPRRHARTCEPRARRRARASRSLDDGAPFLGICLGMQLLAATGDEGERHRGPRLDRRRRCDRLVPDRQRRAHPPRRAGTRSTPTERVAAVRRHRRRAPTSTSCTASTCAATTRPTSRRRRRTAAGSRRRCSTGHRVRRRSSTPRRASSTGFALLRNFLAL